MGNKGLPIFGIAIISFLMLGGATFGVAPTSDPVLGDGNTITVQNDFLPTAAGQSDEIEYVTGKELMPFYDWETHGDWEDNENRELELKEIESTYVKQQVGFHWEIDEEGFLYQVADDNIMANAHVTPDDDDGILVGDFQTYSISVEPDDPEGVYTFQEHGAFIDDGFGNWEPFLVSEGEGFIQVEFDNVKYVFDTETGSVTTSSRDNFNSEYLMAIQADSYVVRTAELGTDDWSNMAINDEPIVTTVNTAPDPALIGTGLEGTEIVITFTRTNDEGIYTLEHYVRHAMLNPELKTTAYFTNMLYENNKFAFTETLDLTDSEITINEETYDLTDYVGVSFPREVLVENQTLIMQAASIHYNAFLGFDNLWSVNIITPTKVSLDYANIGSTHTPIGETIELDPIWGALYSNDPMANQGTCYYASGGCASMTTSKRVYVYSYNSDWNAQTDCLATGFLPHGTTWSPTGSAFHVQDDYHSIGVGERSCGLTAMEFDISGLRGANIQDIWISHAHNIWSLQAGQTLTGYSGNTAVRPSTIANYGEWGVCCANPPTPSLTGANPSMNFSANYAEDGVAPNANIFSTDTQTAAQHYDFSAQAVTDFNTQLSTTACVNTGDCWFAFTWHVVDYLFIAPPAGNPYATPSGATSGTIPGYPDKPAGGVGCTVGNQYYTGNAACNSYGSPSYTGGETSMYSGYTKLGLKFTMPPPAPENLATVQSTGGQADLTWDSSDCTTDRSTKGCSMYYVSNVAHPNTDFGVGGYGNCNTNGLPPTSPTLGTVGAHGNGITFNGVCDYIGGNASNALMTPSTNDVNGTPTNEYSLNLWLRSDCSTWKYVKGYFGNSMANGAPYVSGVNQECVYMPLGTYNTQNFGYLVLNGKWSGGTGSTGAAWGTCLTSPCAYTDKNVMSFNGLYTEEHAFAGWNWTAGTSAQPTWGTWGGVMPENGSSSAGHWWMITMTVDANKNTVGYLNGMPLPLWTYPGACMGGTTFDHANAGYNGLGGVRDYGYGVLPGVPKSANYTGCSNSYETTVGSKSASQLMAMTIGCSWHTSGGCSYPFKGSMDEITTWNKVLTEAEVVSLYGGSYGQQSWVSPVSLTQSHSSEPEVGTRCIWSCFSGHPVNPSVIPNWEDHLVNYIAFEESGTPIKNMAVKPATFAASGDAATYNIDRDGTTIATGVTDLFYDDTSVTAGNTYVYKVLGITPTGTSEYSATSSITVAGVPDQVTGLVGTSGATPVLDWTAPNDNGGAITNYKIYRDTVLHDTVGNVLTYTDSTSVVIGTTYDYTVSAVNSMGEGPQSAAVAVTAATPPDAPTSVDATAVPNQINLTWVTPGSDNGSTITGYKIFRTDNLTTPIATVGVVNAWNGDASGTIGVSYTYNVHAVNAMGDSPAGVSDTVVHGNVPAQVIVSSVAALLGLAIKIDWGEPVANGYAISSYVVESTVNGGTSWTSVGTPNALTITHQNLTEANDYQYRVSAVNALGTGTPSAMTTPAVTAGDVPDAPSGHSATQSGVAEIGLAWAEPDDHEYSIDEYRIYRSLTTGGTYTLLVDGLTGLTHTDTSLTVSQAYFYKIQAHNSLGWSADSTIVSATAANVPDQVTGMSSQAIAGSDVVLTWNAAGDNSSVITNYFIEYSLNNATWQTKATVGNVLTYTAQYTQAENGSTYYWRASAINAIGTGAVSASTNTVIGDVPGQVGGLTATAQSATEIDLSWNVPADNGYAITVYKVERSLDDSNWTTLTSTHTLTTYDDTGLTASTDYYYKISASNALGIGTASTSVLEKTFGVPSDITDLALTVASTTQINLSWSAPALNGFPLVDYEIFQSEDGTNWTSIGEQTTLTRNVIGLDVNDLYYFKVTTENTYGTSNDSNVENVPTLPTPPAATNATAVSDTAINVSWNQPAGDQQTSYKIERSLDDTNWTTLVASTGNTNTTYSDTGLSTLTTYYYKVSTINPSGTSSASPSGNAKTFGSPDAPTSLTATALIAIDIDLDWDAPTENNGAAVSGYKIERSTDDINYAVIVADTGNTDTDYTDTDAALVTDTTYYYRVSAINSFGAGATSNVASVLAGDKPNQVTGLVVTSATTSTLDLDWVAPNDNGYTISGYKIEKSLDGTNFTVLVASNTDLDYTDTSLNTNQIYYYQVSAINVFATGDVSAVSSAPPLPTPPATLSLSVINNVQIDLTWSDPTGAAETGFKIERSTDNTNWSTIVADTGSTALTYSNTGLTALTDYYYRVSTLNASGESSVGSVETAKTFGTTAAPTNLDALSLIGAQIQLDWEEPTVTNGSAVSGYKIERSTDNVSYSVLVADTGNLNETYTDTGIAGTTYYYRVSALNAFGASPPSNVDSALATDVPAQTTNFTATAQAGNEIDLAWTAPSNGGSAITGYHIERSLDNSAWTDLVANTGNQLVAYTDINLATDQTYYYRVSAINLVGTGTASVVDSDLAGDVPNQITVITATAQAGSEIIIAWTAPAENAYAITVYTVEISTDQTNWSSDGTSATASFTSTGLTNGTTYYYRVTATNALGDSTVSAIVNDKAGDKPSQVTGFTGTALNDTQIKLDWTTPADNSYTITGYKIEQSADNVSWTTIVASTNSSGITYSVTGLTTVTDYYHRVSAINALGTGNTATAVLTTTMGVPDAITNLGGTAVINPSNILRSDITLTWTAPTANGTPILHYVVQVQAIDGSGTWLTLDSNVTSTSKVHQNVFNDTLFSYRVYAVNAIGTSLVSNTGQVWSLPTTPTGLTSSVFSDTSLGLAWDTLTGMTYKLEHSTDNATWTTEADPATTPYSDNGLTTDTTHYYRVYAVNTSGESSASASVSATTQHHPTPPLNLVLTPAIDLVTINLTWNTPTDTGTHNGDPILNYMVDRSPDGTTWTTLPTNCPQAQDCDLTYYDDGPLATSSTFYYRVLAENSVGSDSTNGYSSVVSYTTPTPPNAASNLTAIAYGIQNTQIRVSWVAPGDTGTHGIIGYKIERDADNAGFQELVANTNSAGLYITDSSLTVGVEYDYRVYAITSAGMSAQASNADSVKLVDGSATVSASVVGGNTIEITPSVTIASADPLPEVKLINLYMNGAFVASQTPNSQVTTGTTVFPDMYGYPTDTASFYTIVVFTQDPGGNHQSTVTSNTVSATPSDPFSGELDWSEYRVDPNSSVPSTNDYSQSNLALEIQPVGSDVIVKYTPQNTALDVVVKAFSSVQQSLDEVIDTDPESDYYVAVYIDPQFSQYYTTDANDVVIIDCDQDGDAFLALGLVCKENDVPLGYKSDIAFRSLKDPTTPTQLGIEGMGDLFGMPMVMLFVVGIAAVFTGRSAQMGGIILVALISVMIYLGYLPVWQEPALWIIIVMIAAIGIFIGKRWS